MHHRRGRGLGATIPGTSRGTAAAASLITSTGMGRRRNEVVLADQLWWWNVFGIKAVFTRPRSGVTADTFSIEDLLRYRHDLVDGRPARVRRIGVAARLDSLYFC